MNKALDLLKTISVELRVPRVRSRNRSGKCYELAGRGILEHPRGPWTLVHGTVRAPDGRRLGHAWLERGGLVYDPVMDFLFTKPDYRRLRGAAVNRRYTKHEAAGHMSVTRTYGPWHKTSAYGIHLDC